MMKFTLGWLKEHTDVAFTVTHADNSLNGNGLQEMRMLARDRSSIYTLYDQTDSDLFREQADITFVLGPPDQKAAIAALRAASASRSLDCCT